jgi:hypothetical protein
MVMVAVAAEPMWATGKQAKVAMGASPLEVPAMEKAHREERMPSVFMAVPVAAHPI